MAICLALYSHFQLIHWQPSRLCKVEDFWAKSPKEFWVWAPHIYDFANTTEQPLMPTLHWVKYWQIWDWRPWWWEEPFWGWKKPFMEENPTLDCMKHQSGRLKIGFLRRPWQQGGAPLVHGAANFLRPLCRITYIMVVKIIWVSW